MLRAEVFHSTLHIILDLPNFINKENLYPYSYCS